MTGPNASYRSKRHIAKSRAPIKMKRVKRVDQIQNSRRKVAISNNEVRVTVSRDLRWLRVKSRLLRMIH